MTDFPLPALTLIFGAALLPLIFARARIWLVTGLPLIALAWIWYLPVGDLTIPINDGTDQLNLFLLGRLFATAFLIMSFAGNIFACNQARTTELAAALLYAGSAVGVALSTNFVSLLIFIELMMLGSTWIVFNGRTSAASRAGIRYFLLHVLSGVLLFTGVLGLHFTTGDLALRAVPLDTVYAWLILAGFLINAGAPPLSAWVADAYPEASASGTVYLSAFTTKAAVFSLLVVFAGESILIPVGLYMIFYGIVYALMENDIRRILAYSIVNQVGFMVTGIGIGSALALNGVALHAFTHIIYKALLLMSAGSVLMMTGHRRCTDLGGLYRSMRLTTVCAVVGALAISSFPLTSGFISKTMISESALPYLWVWLLLLMASAGVFLHAGIKFPWFVFFQKNTTLEAKDPPLNMQIAMVFFAALCILIGIFPETLYAIAPWRVDYVPYTAAHVVEKLQLLLFGGCAFFIMLPWLKRTRTLSLDIDWLYRKLWPRLETYFGDTLATRAQQLARLSQTIPRRAMHALTQYCRANQLLSDNAQSSALVGWLLALLAVLLFIYY